MPDDQNTTQNPIPKENSIPPSSQEPTADAPIPPIDSEPAEALPEAPEASEEGFSDESNNIPPSNSTLTEPSSEPKPEEKSAPSEPSPEPVSEPVEVPEPQTAQIPGNEPLPEQETKTSEPEPKPQTSYEQAEPVRAQPKLSNARQLLVLARNSIQFRKRKKLDRALSMFLKHSKITNDEVEKFLHVSDATATRYLSQLEKEGKIKQNGKIGKGVSYSRI